MFLPPRLSRGSNSVFFISSNTFSCHPAAVLLGRLRQTIQIDDDRDARLKFLKPPVISVAIGQLATTRNPARIIALTSVSHASTSLLANTTTKRPSSARESKQRWNERAIPSSYACFAFGLSPPNLDSSWINSPSFVAAFHLDRKSTRLNSSHLG